MRQIIFMVLLLAGLARGQSGRDDFSFTTTGILYDTNHYFKTKPYNYCLIGKPRSKLLIMDSTWVDSTFVIVGNDTIPLRQWSTQNPK